MASTLRVTTGDHVVQPAPRARAPVAGATPSGLTVTDLLLLLMALIWGVNFIVAKYGTQVFAPLVFNSARVALAVLVLWILVLARRVPLPARRDVVALLGLGLLGNGLYQILFVEGLARARASDTSLILAASPAFIAIIGWMRRGERIGWRGVSGIVLSLSGIGLVVLGAPVRAAGDSTMLGLGLMIAASLSWSLYSVVIKPYTERIDGLMLSAITITGGLVPVLVAAFPDLADTPWPSVGVTAWLAVAYSGLFALVVASLFWYRGVRTLGPMRASMYANVQPLFAMVAAWAVLHETPRVLQLAGGACIMSGLLLTRLPGSSSPMPGE